MCLTPKRWRRGCSRGDVGRLGGGAPLALAADGAIRVLWPGELRQGGDAATPQEKKFPAGATGVLSRLPSACMGTSQATQPTPQPHVPRAGGRQWVGKDRGPPAATRAVNKDLVGETAQSKELVAEPHLITLARALHTRTVRPAAPPSCAAARVTSATSVRRRRAWHLLAGCRLRPEASSALEGYVIDGQPEPRPGRVRFTATADIERLLADAPAVRTALLEEGVPTSGFGVVADAGLTVLHSGGHSYIRFATTGNGDPVAVELPSGRVAEMVTRRNPPPQTIVSIALYSTSLRKFCEVWEAFHAREPFYSHETYGPLLASGQIERLRTDLLASLGRVDPGAAAGLWADLAWDIDMGDFPAARGAVGDRQHPHRPRKDRGQ